MGRFWLHDLPAEAAKRGLRIDTYSGWELRSRSTGGFDAILGIVMHHTASNARPENDMAFQWLYSGDRPIANISLHRDGRIVLGAAGASNHAGRGGGYYTSKGYVPQDSGNRYFIGIEACNTGVGEVWPDAQIRAYEKLVEVLCDVYALDPTTDVLLHATWAPTRKIDPAGPTPAQPGWGGLSGARTWDLAQVRRSVLESEGGIPGMSSFEITNPVRIVDSRYGTPHNSFKMGSIPAGWRGAFKPHGFTEGDADGVILTVTGIAPGGGGHFVFWSGDGQPPSASNVNPARGLAANNMVWVPLDNDGKFSVFAGGTDGTGLGLIIDQVGWYKNS